MTAPWPDHLLTLADWDQLAEDTSHRYELSEGALSVSPRPTSLHQRVVQRLIQQIELQIPLELEVLREVEVVIDSAPPPTVRVPDLCVVPAIVNGVKRWDPADVTLVVEVLSPDTRRTDRVTKFAEYARAGIEHYWMIDLEAPASITVCRLLGTHYELVVEADRAVGIEVADCLVTIDPASLVGVRGVD